MKAAKHRFSLAPVSAFARLFGGLGHHWAAADAEPCDQIRDETIGWQTADFTSITASAIGSGQSWVAVSGQS